MPAFFGAILGADAPLRDIINIGNTFKITRRRRHLIEARPCASRSSPLAGTRKAGLGEAWLRKAILAK